jgi:hypothetical protein
MQECSVRHELGLALAGAVAKLADTPKDAAHSAERGMAHHAAQKAKQEFDRHVAEHKCHDAHDLCADSGKE